MTDLFANSTQWLALVADLQWNDMRLSTPVALAAVATLGYLIGVRNREKERAEGEAQGRRELKRAREVAKELERIAEAVRRSIATHHTSISKFKDRVSTLGGNQEQ